MQLIFWSARIQNHHRQTGKATMWILITLGVLFGIVLYWYTAPQQAPAWARNGLPGLSSGQAGLLYRWRDDQGRLQVTDQPPKNRPYETVRYRRDSNVMPSINSGVPR